MTSAVVLGGGGIAGVAWEAGIAAGLQREGVDLAQAGVVVGTSAGSIVGSWLASGSPLAELAAHAGRPAPGARPGPGADLDTILTVMAPLFDPALDPAVARRRVGAAALAAVTGGEEEYIRGIASLLPPPRQWPRQRLLVTAVDAGSGEPAVWEGGSGVPLERAVAASCAVPGLFPPVTIGGRRYMDGGVRSVTNADLAAGASAVVVLNALGHLVPPDQLTAELASLGAAATVVISPDQVTAGLMGANLMDPTVAVPVLEAAMAQAASCAADVRARWTAGS